MSENKLSESTLRKIKKNVEYLNAIRPLKTSQYRANADAIIQQYANREITNFKTALKFVLKLSSKRPEIASKKFDIYVNANKPQPVKRSFLDAGIKDDEPVSNVAKKKISVRSTPAPKPTMKQIKNMVPKKRYEFFVRTNVRTTTTYERTNKNRKTKLMHTYYHKVPNAEYVNKTIMATSEDDAKKQFEDEIDTSVVSTGFYKANKAVDGVDFSQVKRKDSFTPTSGGSMLMKSACNRQNCCPIQNRATKN